MHTVEIKAVHYLEIKQWLENWYYFEYFWDRQNDVLKSLLSTYLTNYILSTVTAGVLLKKDSTNEIIALSLYAIPNQRFLFRSLFDLTKTELLLKRYATNPDNPISFGQKLSLEFIFDLIDSTNNLFQKHVENLTNHAQIIFFARLHNNPSLIKPIYDSFKINFNNQLILNGITKYFGFSSSILEYDFFHHLDMRIYDQSNVYDEHNKIRQVLNNKIQFPVVSFLYLGDMTKIL